MYSAATLRARVSSGLVSPFALETTFAVERIEMRRCVRAGLLIFVCTTAGALGQGAAAAGERSVYWDLHCAPNIIPSPKEINHPHLAGGFVGVPWDMIEPTPTGGGSSFDFTRVETHVALWDAGGKRSILRTNIFGKGCLIEWPFSFPRWMIPAKTPWPSAVEGVYTCEAEEENCVDVVAFLPRPTDEEVTLLPKVWDSPKFLSLYENYVAGLAAAYDGDSRVSFVLMGIGHGGYTTVNSSNGGDEALALPEAGWTPELWKQYIFDVIDIYTTHFTQTPLILGGTELWTKSYLQDDIVEDMEEITVYAVERGASLLLNGLDTEPIRYDLTPFTEILQNLLDVPLPEGFTLIMGDDWPLWIDEERRIVQPFLSDRDDDGFRCLLQTTQFAWDRLGQRGDLMVKVLRDEIEVTNSLLPNGYRPEVAASLEEFALGLAEDCNGNNLSDVCEDLVICDDGVSCTDDFCNTGSDSCDVIANHANCSNDVFCDGAEVCDPLLDCGPGPDPCPGLLCDEAGDRCVDCFTDMDCDDGQFCDGVETCLDGDCQAGIFPCPGQGCNEGTDTCATLECVDDGECDDGSACTADACVDNVCVNGCESEVAGFPYTEAFESVSSPWENIEGDEFDWRRIVGETPTAGTGPPGDHTTGTRFYRYIETTGQGAQGDTAILAGPCVDLTRSSGAHLSFWYHMFGVDIDSLGVEVSGDCTTWTSVWTLAGDQGDAWFEGDVSLDAYVGSKIKVRFVATRGAGELGDIAIDDIGVDVVGIACSQDADCDDGQFCNGMETCVAEICVAGIPLDCDDGVECTDDACNEGADLCINESNDTHCDDGLFCNGAETCDPELDCQAGIEVNCDDGVECTEDSCDEDADACVNAPNDASCSDGIFCTGIEICDPVIDCRRGPEACDDRVDCTDDSCDEEAQSCTNVTNDAKCSNGLFCDGEEICDPVLDCRGRESPCDDGVGCTDDVCDEDFNTCMNVASDANCDDGRFCSGVETCDPVLDCQSGSDPCDDGVGCTDDFCDEELGTCTSLARDGNCDDDLFCNGRETCDPALDCQPGTPRCDDGVACTVDVCDEIADTCSNTPNDSDCDDGLFCNGAETCHAAFGCREGSDPCVDGVGCTDDVCDELLDTCANTPNDANCDDGRFCNGAESCDFLLGCVGGPQPCDDGVACTDDFCDDDLDTCTNLSRDGLCDDGLFCNGREKCDSEIGCQSALPACDDGVLCTDDSCDEGTDSCTNIEIDAECSDGLFCNGEESCHSVFGCQDEADPCVDGIGCTDDLCDEGSDTCSYPVNDANCDNGLFCDGVETCDPVLDCQGGVAPCVDSVGCTDDICDEDLDTCSNTANDANCDNGLFCDGVETCDPDFDCQHGPEPCIDTVGCTDDLCNEELDTCSNQPNDANCDDGRFCTGLETCDPVLDCQSGSDPCDDGVGCTDDFCDDESDTCTNIARDGLCDDGLFCNGQETCDAALDCQGGSPPCADGVACTDDACDEETDTCSNIANDAHCSDGLFCNGEETCHSVFGCQAGADPCVDGIGCTDDLCDEGSGTCSHVANDTNCDNGLFCDGVEFCDPVLDCRGGADPCVDSVGCTDDLCDEDLDTCSSTANDANCDNGRFCDGVETCDPVLDCQHGAEPCKDAVGCTDDLCDDDLDSCSHQPNDANCDNGAFCDGFETCDIQLGCVAGADPCPGLGCDEIGDQCFTLPTARLESRVLSVGGDAVTVSLTNTYDSAVVVCSVNYNHNTVPVVTRVSGVTGTSFDVRLQNPLGAAVVADDVHCLIVEEGTWTIDDVKVEAQTYLSSETDHEGSWLGAFQFYGQAYFEPVVLGQVMSVNDADWSVFWDRGRSRSSPPTDVSVRTGKTICEDTVIVRADEIVGFIVIEAGHGTISGVEFEAAVGSDTVRGVTNVPPYTYTFDTAFGAAPQVALVTMAGMDGTDGAWAYTFGEAPLSVTSIDLAVDEDQVGDTERSHGTEQVNYVVFETDVVFP